MNGLFLRRVN